jgi:hypothetical protein
MARRPRAILFSTRALVCLKRNAMQPNATRNRKFDSRILRCETNQSRPPRRFVQPSPCNTTQHHTTCPSNSVPPPRPVPSHLFSWKSSLYRRPWRATTPAPDATLRNTIQQNRAPLDRPLPPNSKLRNEPNPVGTPLPANVVNRICEPHTMASHATPCNIPVQLRPATPPPFQLLCFLGDLGAILASLRATTPPQVQHNSAKSRPSRSSAPGQLQNYETKPTLAQ